MINPTFDILNQRGTPMFFSDVFANRPAAAIVGRIFISTDTFEIYRDTGTTWNLIGSGTSTIGGSIATGQIAFGTATNTIGGTNSLFYDNTNARVGIGTNLPTADLQIEKNQNGITDLQIRNTTSGTSSRALLFLTSSNGYLELAKLSALTTTYKTLVGNDAYIYNVTSGDISILNDVATGKIKFSILSSSAQMTLSNTGNLLIGSVTDTGELLQVNGTMKVTGASTFGADTYKIRSISDSGGAGWTNIGGVGTNPQIYLYQAGTSAIVQTYINGVARLEVTNTGIAVTGAATFSSSVTANSLVKSGGLSTEYLKADGSVSTLTNPITGTGASGQVAYWSGASTQVGSNNLFWDNTNGRLGIGTASPLTSLQIDASNPVFTFRATNGGTDQKILYLQNVAGELLFSKANDAYNTFTNFVRITNGGNLIVNNANTDSGQRLQVTGDTLLKGSGATSATTALTVQNSASTNMWRFLNDGQLLLGSNASGAVIHPSGTNGILNIAGLNTTFYTSVITQAFGTGAFHFSGSTLQSTSGFNTQVSIDRQFSPTSGTAQMYYLFVSPTINQTGGANGITRGLYVNPTLTAAADWRSIEWSNNSGFGLYGAGTSNNYLNGILLLGSTTSTAAAEKLQITGSQITTDTRTYSTGSIQTSRYVKNITIPSAATISSGNSILTTVLTGTSAFQGSVSIPNSTIFATIYAANIYSIDAASITVTSTQAANLRAIAQIDAQNYFAGSSSGTFTHIASAKLSGYYNNNTGSITPTITNAYQLLINDIADYGHTFTFTNRWGIYQEGSNDRNYLAGNLMLNSTTDTGQKLQINGTIRVNGQTSGTAGGSSGQHLIINCDGTDYKIALLNT